MNFIKEYGTSTAILIIGAVALVMLIVPAPHPLEGKIAPDFTLPLLGGGEINLAQHRGKDIVVLDFWASWCPPCRAAMTAADSVAKHFSNESVAVYAINIQESPGQVKHFVDTVGATLPVLMDEKGLVAEDYSTITLPILFVIDREGQIRNIHQGIGFGHESSLIFELQALLDETAAVPE